MAPTLPLPALLALLVACTPELTEVEVEACPVPTVLEVRWTSPEPGISWVEHGAPGEARRSTAISAQPSTEHEVVVYGLPAGTDQELLPITLTEGGERLEGELLEVAVEPPPREVVELEAHAVGESAVDGLVLTTQYGPEASFVVVHDRHGRVVWHHQLPDATNTLGAEPTLDGLGLMYLVFDRLQAQDRGEAVRVTLCGDEELRTPAELGHHDLAELPGGRVAWLGLDTREAEVEGETLWVTGDTILEAVEGEEDSTELFNFFDDYADPWPASPEFEVEAYQTGGRDWTRTNSLLYREADDTLLLMSRNLDALLAVDRGTGELLWQMGGELGDFEIIGEPWDHGHFSWYEGSRLLVFDNGDNRDPPHSRVVEYAVDEGARTATEVWSTTLDEPDAYVHILGDAKRLEGGHTLVSWSTLGQLTEVDPEGELLWEAEAPLGTALGRVVYLRDLDPGLR